jgi:23S rRNA pseudouridine955/2504/2580 synthase/23S rRNA pseudouridine1911/1915/1917 synthase
MSAQSIQVKRPVQLEILWQSERLVAIAKPAGLATIPGRGETTSALEQLAAMLGLPHSGDADPRVRVVHRLDKDTSGVLLFAKDKDAQRHLSHQFQNNAVAKEYLAICVGRAAAREGEINAPISVNPNAKTKMMVSESTGRPARTAWRIEEALGDYCLVRCFPKTGKTHQIRVHLKHIGLPLAVDPLYNPPRPPAQGGIYLSHFKRGYRPTAGEVERPLIDRLTLHAQQLRFADLDNRVIEIAALVPKDMRAALNQLRKFARR